MPEVVYYGDSYPRHWDHRFPEIKDEIGALFAVAGEAEVLRDCGLPCYLVHLTLEEPARVRRECCYDGTAGVAINGDTGACIRQDAQMYRWPVDGEREVWFWLDYQITVYKEDSPEGRTVKIEELRARYRAFAQAMTKVWEII